MTRKPKTIAFWRGRLPHWEVEDGRYFVTIHLAGAIPAAGRERLRVLAAELAKLRRREPAWIRLQRMIFGEMERWLDRAEWNTALRRKEIAEIVGNAIAHRQQRGDWNMLAWVVMPTHVHLFFELGSAGLKETVEDFKRWTAHQAVPLVGGDRERFWQREWLTTGRDSTKRMSASSNTSGRTRSKPGSSATPLSGRTMVASDHFQSRSRLPGGTSAGGWSVLSVPSSARQAEPTVTCVD